MTNKGVTKPLKKPFSEVIYSTNELVIAQCYKEPGTSKSDLNSLSHGKVVKVKNSYDASYATFGLITKINNSSVDNIHKPSALGLSSTELMELQPQIYDLLRKEIEIYLFAYKRNEKEIIVDSPPHPMLVHDFVYYTDENEIFKLTEDFSNLANLVKKHGLKANLLAELISTGYRLRNNDYNYLVKKAQELSLIFSDEIDSLMILLKKLTPAKRMT